MEIQYGDPWKLLDALMSRYELLDELDLPFPLGGCFGYWGYDLKNFIEPKLPRRALNDLELPDCAVGFYDSLVAFDHALGKTWIISTGLNADGSRDEYHASARAAAWEELLFNHEDGAHLSECARPQSRPDISRAARSTSPLKSSSIASKSATDISVPATLPGKPRSTPFIASFLQRLGPFRASYRCFSCSVQCLSQLRRFPNCLDLTRTIFKT